MSGTVLNTYNISPLNSCNNPIRRVLVSLPPHFTNEEIEVRNLLRITQLVSGGARIKSLDCQSPNVLPFLNAEE